MLVMYNIIIIVQTNEYVDFINENDTVISFDLKNELIFKQDVRQIAAYGGSGDSTTIDSSTYTTMNITLVSTETKSIGSSTIAETVTSLSETPTYESSPTVVNTSTHNSTMSTQTSIYTSGPLATTSTTTTTPTCNNQTHITYNDNCSPKLDVQIDTFNILYNNSIDTNVTASALSSHISSITDTNMTLNSNYTLTSKKIDELVKNMSAINLSINTNESFIMAQELPPNGTRIISGASFTRGIGGKIVENTIAGDVMNMNISIGAIVNSESLADVKSLNMLIIDKPTTYRGLDTASNKTLVSSIVVVGIVPMNNSPSKPVNISLYFQVLKEYELNGEGDYLCSYIDESNSRWNESGCTTTKNNSEYNRFECSCNHTTTFALLWSPKATTANTTTPTPTPTTTIITTTPFNPDTCDNETSVRLPNGTCISKSDGQISTYNILLNSNNSTEIIEALSVYISSITGLDHASNSNFTFSIDQINNIIYKIDSDNLTASSNSSFIMAQAPEQNNVTVVGASFKRGTGGVIVNNLNQDNVTKSYLSTAAIINKEFLNVISSLNILIINDPDLIKLDNNSSNNAPVSSIIVVGTRKKNNTSTNPKMNITLYFQLFNQSKQSNVTYFCSFYDNNTSSWNESGCTKPGYNEALNRFECSCDHLTSFALLWLPNAPCTWNLTPQDIASLVFQSISILCFLAIIIHGLTIRICNPVISIKARDLLPLISCAVTMILFVFYIALGMTVYTKKLSENDTQCFTSASVLMFFVYFFLIFMFCVKTSIGYFNFLRFVHLFPEPSHRKLYIMLLISFFIAITWVSFAAGFNSNPSFNITQIRACKICWFTNDSIHYFLTIPTCIFLVVNFIVIILVTKRIIDHVKNATSPHQSFERMKRCVLVLLSSCVTQGLGWLFGPLLTIVNPGAGEVLGWLFVIFNGLEGLWAIILYMIIQGQHMDERKRVTGYKELTESTSLSFRKGGKRSKKDLNRSLTSQAQTSNRDSERGSHSHNDLYDIETTDWPSSQC